MHLLKEKVRHSPQAGLFLNSLLSLTKPGKELLFVQQDSLVVNFWNLVPAQKETEIC